MLTISLPDVEREEGRWKGPLDGRTDEQLAAAAAGGDERAFEALVRRHLGLLTAACNAVTSDGHERDDALQAGLTDIWRGLPGFRGESRVSTWMYQLARNAAVRTATRGGWRAPVEVVAEVPDRREHPEWEHAGATREAVVDALGRLPEDQREALLLAAAGELRYEEIADIQMVAVGTVKARVSRARARLVELMDGDGRG